MSAKPRIRNCELRVERANTPRLFVCPVCGETLSGPARFYRCPGPLPEASRRAPAVMPFKRKLS